MESKRQHKISKLIQKDVGDILQKKQNLFPGNTLITLTKVNITKDLSLARIFVSIFGTKDKKETLEIINSSKGEIRYELGQRIRNQLRKVPDLQFYEDDSLDYIERIENLLE